MRKISSMMIMVFLMLTAFASNSFAENGIITVKSNHSVKETLDRLEKILTEKGVNVVLRLNHSENGNKAGIALRPTELLLFGNPKLGTNFFTSKQTSGIDLPMKALAWEDENGQVWLTYNDPSYIAGRHGIKDRDEVVKKMTGALEKFTSAATSK